MRSFEVLQSMLQATSAYGRTYASEKELLADWQAGKDFRIKNGPYFSIRNLDELKRRHSHIEFTWYTFAAGFGSELRVHRHILEL